MRRYTRCIICFLITPAQHSAVGELRSNNGNSPFCRVGGNMEATRYYFGFAFCCCSFVRALHRQPRVTARSDAIADRDNVQCTMIMWVSLLEALSFRGDRGGGRHRRSSPAHTTARRVGWSPQSSQQHNAQCCSFLRLSPSHGGVPSLLRSTVTVLYGGSSRTEPPLLSPSL